MTKDVAGGVTNIEWTPSGKVRKVTKSTGSPIEFRYDASGNRVEKKQGTNITRYIRDASGNVMAVYQADTLSERPIYGSSRLGNLAYASKPGYRTVGYKQYELSNHLGNVLTVVSDRIHMNTESTWAEVLSRTDYYPFGLEMTGRTESNGYRYGFQGQEKDDEIKGSGNHLSFGDYGYDPRVGRRWNVDPKAAQMPAWSPYSAMINNPIMYVDPDGQIPWPVMKKWVTSTGNTIIRRIDSEFGMRTLNGRTRQHSGLDMNLGAGRQDLGVPIYATHDGIVKINRDKSDNNDAGNRVHIESNDGTLKTVYMHMKNPSSLPEGAEIKEGDIIGYIGGTAKGQDNKVDASGKRTAGTDVHLHYELHLLEINHSTNKKEFVPKNPLNNDGTLKDPQKMIGLPSNEKLPEDLRDNSTNIKPKN